MDPDPAIEIYKRINSLRCANIIRRHVRRTSTDILVDGEPAMSFIGCKCGGARSYRVKNYAIPYGSHDICDFDPYWHIGVVHNGRIVHYRYDWR